MNQTRIDVQQIYRHRFPEAAQVEKARIWRVLVESFFQKWVAPEHTALDLGCGYGEFLNFLQCRRKIGVDLNPDSPTKLTKGVGFELASVCDLHFLADNSVDFAFASNLMEHLPGKSEVDQMISEVFRVLKPSGQFVMMGPNLRLLPGSYWDFWDHVVPISDLSLVEALENHGFAIKESHAKFLPYTTRSVLPQSPALVKLYLSTPLIWKLLGKQFLVRASKP